MKNRLFIGTLIAGLVLLLASCYTPSPLYGTWCDNAGDKIAFMDDGSFTATITYTNNYSGTWSVIDNVITLNIVHENLTYRKISEWDIRGAMLYLDWTDENGTSSRLTLYHTAR